MNSTPRCLGRLAAGVLSMVLLGGCSGGPGTTPPTAEPVPVTTPGDASTQTSDDAPVSIPPRASETRKLTPLESHQRVGFLMPSENVACLIEEQGVTCDIRNTSYQHTVVNAADCVEPTVELYRDRPQWTCSRSSRFVDAQVRNDGEWVRRVPGGEVVRINSIQHAVLPYGHRLEAFDFRCVSKKSGVQCVRLSDHRGFRLASQDYELF